MIWNIVSDRPIYIQLVEHIKLAIAAGFFKPGDRLPSVRDLAAEASVNANTMQRAMAELESEGLVVTQRTSGRTVTDDDETIRQVKDSIAASLLNEFIEKMGKLGYTNAETIEYFEKKTKGDMINE